jgi:hypothetical protein
LQLSLERQLFALPRVAGLDGSAAKPIGLMGDSVVFPQVGKPYDARLMRAADLWKLQAFRIAH